MQNLESVKKALGEMLEELSERLAIITEKPEAGHQSDCSEQAADLDTSQDFAQNETRNKQTH